MSTSELQPQLPPSPEGTLVTVVPELKTLYVTGLVEGPDIEHTWAKPGAAEMAAERLAAFYIALGPGEHTLDALRKNRLVAPGTLWAACNQLKNNLPEEVFSFDDTEGAQVVRFGTFAVASRRATEADRANHKAKEQAVLEAKKIETEKADLEKIDLTTYDHALIKCKGRDYYLPLTSYEAVLAARTIEAIEAGAEHVGAISLKDLSAMIWDRMPLVERQLYTGTQKYLYGNGRSLISEQVSTILTGMAAPIGIENRRRGLSVIAGGVPLSITFHAEAPEQPYENTTAIFPPGTKRSLVQAGKVYELREEDLRTTEEVLTELMASSQLNHMQALEVIDVLTDPRAKHLARQVLGRMPGVEFHKTLEALDAKAQHSLGKSRYHEARLSRTIGGHSGAKRVEQVSGRLPGRTFRYLGNPELLQKWHIARQG